jgi:hypothetical protein
MLLQHQLEQCSKRVYDPVQMAGHRIAPRSYIAIATDDRRDELHDVFLLLDGALFLEILNAARGELREDLLAAAEASLRLSNARGAGCRAAGFHGSAIVHCGRAWRHGGLHAWWDYIRLAEVWDDDSVPPRNDRPSNLSIIRSRARRVGISKKQIDSVFVRREATERDQGWRMDVLMCEIEAVGRMDGIDFPFVAYGRPSRARRRRRRQPPPVVRGMPYQVIELARGRIHRVEVLVSRQRPTVVPPSELEF